MAGPATATVVGMVELSSRRELPAADAAQVRELLIAVHAAGDRVDLAEDAASAPPADSITHLTAGLDGRIVGYARVAAAGDSLGNHVAELAVHPAARRRGAGAALLAALLDRRDADRLRIWAHGLHPGAVRLAERFGLRSVRELWQMRAPLAADLAEPRLPAGVRIRGFVAEQDEAAVVEVNRRAFAWHPEQGAMTVADVRAQAAQSWFDPAGFLLAVDERDRLLGFHWTKVHAGSPPVGEVYVVGVDPAAHGRGLGTALTLAGLRHLRDCGLGEVLLYVESDNAAAIRVYERLGFARSQVDVQFVR